MVGLKYLKVRDRQGGGLDSDRDGQSLYGTSVPITVHYYVIPNREIVCWWCDAVLTLPQAGGTIETDSE